MWTRRPGATACLTERSDRRYWTGCPAGYFAAPPAAAAFQWKRIGLMAGDLGDFALARTAFARSFRLHPHVNTIWHLLRAVPRTAHRDASADAQTPPV